MSEATAEQTVIAIADAGQPTIVIADLLQPYTDLNLSAGGDVAKYLMRRVEKEASQEQIYLTDIIGPQPANLTPAMRDWYQSCVGPIRNQALKSLSRMFDERPLADGAQGFLLQSRVAKLDEKLGKSKRACYKSVAEKYSTDAEDIERLSKELRQRRNEFEDRRAELGRDPKILNPFVYCVGLLFILVAESFLNFASFSALSWATPFIATGSTLIVAACIAFAADVHGTFLRRYDYYFGPAHEDVDRSSAWRAIILGSVALIFALAFVYYARSAYLAMYLASVGAFGLSGQGHSAAWIIGGSLLGNVLVYLVGCGWAWLLHDADPKYPDMKKGIDSREAQYKALYQKLAAIRGREIDKLNAQFARDEANAKQANTAFISQAYFQRPLQLLARFQGQDGRVVGLLQEYRSELLKAMKDRGNNILFVASNDDPSAPTKWTPAEYQRCGDTVLLHYNCLIQPSRRWARALNQNWQLLFMLSMT
jgi:hypothetical protein